MDVKNCVNSFKNCSSCYYNINGTCNCSSNFKVVCNIPIDRGIIAETIKENINIDKIKITLTN